jgi:1-acyl-sn-glycerol-3-phosphate acyltransferase
MSSPESAEVGQPEIIDPFDPEVYDRVGQFYERWFGATSRYDLRIQEHLPPGRGIVSPHHVSMADTALVGLAALEFYDRPIRFLAKDALWTWKYLKVGSILLERGGAIKLDRSRNMAGQTAKGLVDKVLDSEELLGSFGEGTRTPGPIVGKLRRGLAKLSLEKNAPIQAVGVSETGWKSRRKVVVCGRVLIGDTDGLDFENRKLVRDRSIELIEETRRAMQEATDEANRIKSKTQVYIPHFRSGRVKTSD